VLRCKREEVKITAWENLQKAKAEAAIRKLEVLFAIHMTITKMFQFFLCYFFHEDYKLKSTYYYLTPFSSDED